ncbi:MAG: rRNA (uracil1939-C5)-methyltransferase [Candidatus Cloacimonadota bacterium]|jgi:23S rRNA (uracil1939-C5)-methyltransferase|nr:rRNA (uracil1939-C5)-methyltransferase [Candidatus Cloacimonadota bacterium]
MAYKGFGLGFHNSQPVFVSQAVAGDVVKTTVINKKRGVYFAKIEKIYIKSEARRKPDCQVFSVCGGCDWLHISYSKQLNFKQKIVEEIFRNDAVEKIENIEASENEFAYRNKVFMPVQQDPNGKPKLGIFAKNTHEVIAHKNCKLQPPIFDEIAYVFQKYLIASKATIYDENTNTGNIKHLGIRYSKKNDEIIAVVVSRKTKLPFSKQLVRILTDNFPNIVGIVHNINKEKGNKILGKQSRTLFGRNYINENLANRVYQVDYRSFFQVNILIAEKMLKFVKENITQQDVVLDAYCGVGAIGIFLAAKAKWVTGIENNENAINDAQTNAELNNIKNIDFFHMDTKDLTLDKLSGVDFTTVVFDPPRKGLNKTDIDFAKNVPKIIYISCNPTTQMRDVHLFEKYGFKIKKLKCFDMFPQTYHIENVVVLEK